MDIWDLPVFQFYLIHEVIFRITRSCACVIERDVDYLPFHAVITVIRVNLVDDNFDFISNFHK